MPGVQLVPAAMAIGVDHAPEAQRWNEEPPDRQNHAPSLVQAPDCAPEVVVVPLAAGAPAEATDDAAAGVELAGMGETTAVDVASGAADAVPVAKTPAEAAVDVPDAKPDREDAAEELKPDGADVAAGAADDAVPEAPPAAAAQAGAGCRLTLIAPFTTDEPGSG